MSADASELRDLLVSNGVRRIRSLMRSRASFTVARVMLPVSMCNSGAALRANHPYDRYMPRSRAGGQSVRGAPRLALDSLVGVGSPGASRRLIMIYKGSCHCGR